MYIDEVILEGFKTYVNRTVIGGFDQQFNAITGFNGSGKSNILDAIQFLLGSTNKEMLRLKSNITEIIYKEGCSGIEKASVSIKFKCPNKNLRPTGYESCQELLITRQITKDKVSKFFVNGLASNLGKVKALFRSVHLNIDNPHFLVKQGQITKIINLKPGELLGMIQETAGTAIYNKTKIQSEKMITKKDIKLNSINEILRTSIMPQMQKLRHDRKRYTAFKEKENEMKHLNEEIKLHEYASKKSLIEAKQLELSSIQEQLNSKRIQLKERIQRLTEVEGQIRILRNKGSSTIFTEFTKIASSLNEKKNEQRQIRGRLEKIQKDSYNYKEQINSKEEQIERKKQELEWKSKEMINQERQKEEFQNLIRELNASKGQQDAAKIFEKQLQQQQSLVREIESEIKTMTSKLKVLREEEIMENKSREEMQMTNNNMVQSLKALEQEIVKMENLQPPRHVEDPELTNNYLQSLESQKRRLTNQHFQLRFAYNDPVPNFDRSKVKGKLFTLFRVKDKNHERALEIGAGGKLFNIVVENENVSKLVIERECFGKNVSVIPNNKIKFRDLRRDTIEEANKIAKEHHGLARPAYELIQFDKSISNSIMFAFSSFIVCSSQEIAKKIAYHNRSDLACKCVTYEGDIFERGTLTGGHMNPNALILGIYSQYMKIEEKIIEERKKFEGQKLVYNDYLNKMQDYKRAKKQMESKIERKEKMRLKMNDLSTNFKKKNYAEEITAVEQRIQKLTNDLQDQKKKLEDIGGNKKKGGKSVDEKKKEFVTEKRKYEQKIDQLKKQSSLLQVELENLGRKISQFRENDGRTQEEILKLENKLRVIQKQLITIQQQYELKEEQKKKVEREQAVSESKLHFLLSEETNTKNELKKLQNETTSYEKQIQSNEMTIQINQADVKKILEQCTWLDPEKEYEINPDFDYDQAFRIYKALTVDVDRLRKTAKVTIDDHSYEKLQEQYKSLLEKREILEKDKLTLYNNMHDLDEKRTKTLENCYRLVRQNLGKIFNDLLHGATAHLNLIDERDVTQGAELQVQFNKVKKQLSELSGGQRSLLALSFILALLLYKPSPFYILDEIDSALDLSHTENIGYMISQRFPQSQFIIISLKQGMFQNANVLYKVHFAEGESKVDRQVLKKK